MRVEHLLVNRFRNLRAVDVDLDGLWIIFGPNGVGKTNLLEAIAFLASLGERETRDEQLVSGSVRFAMDVARTEEQTFLSKLLGGHRGDDLDLDLEIRGHLEYWYQHARDSRLPDLLSTITHQSLACPRIEYDVENTAHFCPHLIIDRALPDVADAVAEALVRIEHERDPDIGWILNAKLGSLKASLEEGRAPLDLREGPSSSPLKVFRYDTDPDLAEHLVDEAVPEINNALWHEHEIENEWWLSPWRLVDNWLEETDIDAWRLRRCVRLTYTVLSQVAAEIAPPFVRNSGEIVVEPRPVLEWSSIPVRSWIGIRTDEGVLHHSLLGSGTRRWICAAVLEACRQLRGARIRARSHDETIGGLISEAMRVGATDDRIRIELDPSPAIVLVDEPEANLHPSAQGEIAEWLTTLSQQHAAVVVASHSPTFLQIASEHGRCSAMIAGVDGPAMVDLDDDLLGTLDDLGATAGLDRAQILLLTRAIVLVEGKQDVLVLQHFFGRELRQARATVLPIHGVDKAPWLVGTGLLHALRRPIRILFDHVQREMIERDTPPPQGATKEAWTAWNISQALSGLDFMAIPYDDPDIVCALPEQAVRRAFPQGNFPGWDALVERWRRQRGVKLKPMAMSSVGMTSGTDTQFVQTVLANCGEHDTVRPALQRAVRELLASL